MADFTLLLNRFWFRAQQFLLYLALAELVGTSGKVIANLAALHRYLFLQTFPTKFLFFSPNLLHETVIASNLCPLQRMARHYFWFQELDCLRLSYGGNLVSSMYLAKCT